MLIMSSISSFIYWILIYCLFKTVFNIVPRIFTPQINGTSMNLFYRNREIGRENVYLVNAVVQVCKISVKMQWMLSLVMGEGGEARLDCERRLQWTEWGKDGGEGNNNKIHNITITLVTQSYHLSHTEWTERLCFFVNTSAKIYVEGWTKYGAVREWRTAFCPTLFRKLPRDLSV